MVRKGLTAVTVVISIAMVGALPALAGTTRGAAATITVTAGKPSEFKLVPSRKTVPKGVVTFKVTNKGTIVHDFKIAGKKTAKLAPGKTATLRVTLKAGKAPYLCTLPGHAVAGMKGTLTVK